jgi:hypothetical protein
LFNIYVFHSRESSTDSDGMEVIEVEALLWQINCRIYDTNGVNAYKNALKTKSPTCLAGLYINLNMISGSCSCWYGANVAALCLLFALHARG